jgi:hypothetical protein
VARAIAKASSSTMAKSDGNTRLPPASRPLKRLIAESGR